MSSWPSDIGTFNQWAERVKEELCKVEKNRLCEPIRSSAWCVWCYDTHVMKCIGEKEDQ